MTGFFLQTRCERAHRIYVEPSAADLCRFPSLLSVLLPCCRPGRNRKDIPISHFTKVTAVQGKSDPSAELIGHAPPLCHGSTRPSYSSIVEPTFMFFVLAS